MQTTQRQVLVEHRRQYLTNSSRRYNTEGPKLRITERVLTEVIRLIKNGKANSPEQIPAELIKAGPKKLILVLRTVSERYTNGK